MAAIGARAGAAGEEAEHVAGDVMQALALRELLRDVGLVGLHRLEPVGDRCGLAVELGVDREQDLGLVIGDAAQHHAVHVLQVLVHLRHRLDAAVDATVRSGRAGFRR